MNSNQAYTILVEFLAWHSYELLVMLATITGLWRWRISDFPTRIFTVVTTFSFVFEVGAYIVAKQFGYNLYLFRIFSPMELFGYALYLNFCIPQLQRRAVGWITGITGVVLAVAFEVLFPQDIRGAHFLMVESVAIICGCLYGCYTMLLREDDELPTKYVHFWLITSLLSFWCFSFLSLALLRVDDPARTAEFRMLNHLIQVANIIMLIGVIYAFIRLPKLLPAL